LINPKKGCSGWGSLFSFFILKLNYCLQLNLFAA
jgi:hypothetical protein